MQQMIKHHVDNMSSIFRCNASCNDKRMHGAEQSFTIKNEELSGLIS